MNKDDIHGIAEILSDLNVKVMELEATVSALKDVAIIQGMNQETLNNIINEKLEIFAEAKINEMNEYKR